MQFPRTNAPSFDFFDRSRSYIDKFCLYFSYFGEIPSCKTIKDVNIVRFTRWFELESKDIIKIYYRHHYDHKDKKMLYDDVYYILTSGVLINVDELTVHVLFSSQLEEIAEHMMVQAKRFLVKEKKTKEIRMVISHIAGLETKGIKLKKPDVQLAKQYNDDLCDLHDGILKTLRKKNRSGLFLFHGIPGTGKSTYIRFLIHCLNKKVLFIPAGMAANLEAPAMSNLLIQNANTVFIMEDAEELLVSRDNNRNPAISMLLNLTDGLLGDSLGIQIIATFNTDIRNIDEALMRKGRLLALLEFKPLAANKARKLLEELGVNDIEMDQPMTLSDIYHAGSASYTFNRPSNRNIGFSIKTV